MENGYILPLGVNTGSVDKMPMVSCVGCGCVASPYFVDFIDGKPDSYCERCHEKNRSIEGSRS